MQDGTICLLLSVDTLTFYDQATFKLIYALSLMFVFKWEQSITVSLVVASFRRKLL